MITQKIIARTDSLKLDKIISRYGEDSMRHVVFIIVRPDPDSEELIPITIPEDAVGSFRILKPSGNFVIVPMSKSVLASGETAFDVVLPASANTAKGSGYYDIRITSDTDKYYFTAQGDFLIDDNIISDEVLEDVSEVNGLIFPDDFLTVEDHVAYIDDDTISTDSTWSSDKISDEIEAHTGGDVSKTVSGNPVTFEDGAAAPLVKCVTEIQGSQDLHGYDKPWVGGAGVNQYMYDTSLQSDIWMNNVGGSHTESDSEITITTTSSKYSGVYGNGTQRALIREQSTIKYVSFDIKGSASATIIAFDSSLAITTSYQRVVITISAGSTRGFNFYGNENEITIYIKDIMISDINTSTYSPYSNICPITAYTQGEIEVRGKNVADVSSFSSSTIDGISYTNNGNGTISMSGLSTSASWRVLTTFKAYANHTYILSGCPTNGGTYHLTVSGNGLDWRDIIDKGEGATFTAPITGIYNLVFRISNTNISISGLLKPMVRLAQGTDSTFEPYVNESHTATFSTSIYQGNADFVGGTETHDMVVVDLGDFTWSHFGAGTAHDYWRATITDPLPKRASGYNVPANALCSYYENVAGDDVYNNVHSGIIAIPSDNDYIMIYDANHISTSTADFKTAMSGVQFAYEVLTPTTSPVTPTNLPIKSLFGYNHIESSTGEMEVEYITQTYQPIVDLIQSSKHVYSTQEQVVGTWIDGSDLYERTIDLGSFSVSAWSDHTIESSTSIDLLIDYDGYMVESNIMYALPDPSVRIKVDESHNLIFTGTSSWNVVSGYLTIRYTKTLSNNRSLSKGATDSLRADLSEEKKEIEEVPETEEKTVKEAQSEGEEVTEKVEEEEKKDETDGENKAVEEEVKSDSASEER